MALYESGGLVDSSDMPPSEKNEQSFDFKQVLGDLIEQQVDFIKLSNSIFHYLSLSRRDEGIKDRQLGVMFKDLRVIGAGSRTSLQPTVGSPFHPSTFLAKIRGIRNPSLRDILSGFEGVVTPGEMLCKYKPFLDLRF